MHKRHHILCTFEDDDYCDNSEYANKMASYWRDRAAYNGYDGFDDIGGCQDFEDFQTFCNHLDDGILENARLSRDY